MAERFNRDPTYDLGRHIVTGETGPLSGDPAIQKFDAELDRNDPMDSFTAGVTAGLFEGQSAEAIQEMNLTQALGMQSGAGQAGLPVNMQVANDCHDEPSKGGLAYGPRYTDSERDNGGY
jgi:hypothetical protein